MARRHNCHVTLGDVASFVSLRRSHPRAATPKHKAPGLPAQTPGATDANDRLDPPFHPVPACFCPARLARLKWPSF